MNCTSDKYLTLLWNLEFENGWKLLGCICFGSSCLEGLLNSGKV